MLRDYGLEVITLFLFPSIKLRLLFIRGALLRDGVIHFLQIRNEMVDLEAQIGFLGPSHDELG